MLSRRAPAYSPYFSTPLELGGPTGTFAFASTMMSLAPARSAPRITFNSSLGGRVSRSACNCARPVTLIVRSAMSARVFLAHHFEHPAPASDLGGAAYDLIDNVGVAVHGDAHGRVNVAAPANSDARLVSRHGKPLHHRLRSAWKRVLHFGPKPLGHGRATGAHGERHPGDDLGSVLSVLRPLFFLNGDQAVQGSSGHAH